MRTVTSSKTSKSFTKSTLTLVTDGLKNFSSNDKQWYMTYKGTINAFVSSVTGSFAVKDLGGGVRNYLHYVFLFAERYGNKKHKG